MSDCDETLRELDSFLDDELSPDVRTHLQAHLGACMDCLSAFDFHAELKLAIRRKCSNEDMPPGLMARIERCLDEDIDGDGAIGEAAGRA